MIFEKIEMIIREGKTLYEEYTFLLILCGSVLVLIILLRPITILFKNMVLKKIDTYSKIGNTYIADRIEEYYNNTNLAIRLFLEGKKNEIKRTIEHEIMQIRKNLNLHIEEKMKKYILLYYPA
ncbi:MAG: hypothetical protein Pg6C_03240 [Treponemataceae bacterium]|nr:MAG: hypothetical protein Pg6C_03240 [Treponemataceae bacterium]